jgi:hypothetical protein
MFKQGLEQPIEVLANTIPEFCHRHRISVPFYYKLRLQGLAPREMRVGKRVLVTHESAADWRREREAASVPARITA